MMNHATILAHNPQLQMRKMKVFSFSVGVNFKPGMDSILATASNTGYRCCG